MSSAAESIFDAEINLRSTELHHPNYNKLRLVPTTNYAGGVILSAAAQQEVSFELPAHVFNLAKSSLNFNLDMTGPANSYIHTAGVSCIDRVALTTRAGDALLDISSFAQWTKTLMPIHTRSDQKESFGAIRPEVSGTNSRGMATGINPTNSGSGAADFDAPFLVNDLGITDDTIADLSDNPDVNGTQYIALTGAATTGMRINYSIPFSRLVGCLLAVNRDLYFGGEIVILRVQFHGYDRFSGSSADIADLDNTPASVTGVTISDPHVLLAVEQSPIIRSQIMNAVAKEGYSIYVPYTWNHQYALGAGVSPQLLRLNRGHGRTLLRITSAVFDSDQTRGHALNTYNVNSEKMTSHYSSFDNVRINQQDINVANGDGWRYQQDMLEGSCIRGAGQQRANYSWTDTFTNSRLIDCSQRDVMQSGVDLDVERLYEFTGVYTNRGAVPRSIHMFVTVQRELRIINNIARYA